MGRLLSQRADYLGNPHTAHFTTQQLWETEGFKMLKKRIYLPDRCLGKDCPHFNTLTELCKTCPIYREDLTERTNKLIEAHRRASLKYYHKNKNVKKKTRLKKVKNKA